MSDLVLVVHAIGLGRLALALALECAALYLGIRLMLSCFTTLPVSRSSRDRDVPFTARVHQPDLERYRRWHDDRT